MGHACDAASLWRRVSSELFADLFEQWLRGAKRLAWDIADPAGLVPSHAGARSPLRIAFLPPFASEDVRGQTHALFDGGLAPSCELPPVRDGLFGALTAAVVASLRTALRHLRQG